LCIGCYSGLNTPEEMTEEPVQSHQESQSGIPGQITPVVGDSSFEQVQEKSLQCCREIRGQGKPIATEDDKADYANLDS
jgi:hypothetical protein